MTNDEFGDWLRKARTRFPTVARFLDDMPSDDKSNTLLFWWDRLKKHEAQAADAALDALFASEKRVFPADWFQAFARALRGASEERKRETRIFDGERLNDCRYGCSEEGYAMIECHDKASIAYYARTVFGLRSLDDVTPEIAAEIAQRFPVAVACCCSKGQSKPPALRRLNPQRDVLWRRQQAVAAEWKTQDDFRDGPF